jgi:hypothetical protein
MATEVELSPQRVVSVLASDAAATSPPNPVDTTTSPVTPNNQKQSFNVFPNPFSSNLNLSFQLPASGNYTINVYDSRGVLVHRVNGWADAGQKYVKNLATGALAKGVYFVQLLTADNLSTIKVLKL